MAKFETNNCSYTGDAKEGNGALYMYGTQVNKGYIKLVDPLLSVFKLKFWSKVAGVNAGSVRVVGYLSVYHPSYGGITVISKKGSGWSDWKLIEVYGIYDKETDTRVMVCYYVDPNTNEITTVSSTKILSGKPKSDVVEIYVSGGYAYGTYRNGYAVIDSLEIWGSI